MMNDEKAYLIGTGLTTTLTKQNIMSLMSYFALYKLFAVKLKIAEDQPRFQ
jgi:hypothetical protein